MGKIMAFLVIFSGCAPIYKIPEVRKKDTAPLLRVVVAKQDSIEFKGRAFSIRVGNKVFKARSLKVTSQSIWLGKERYSYGSSTDGPLAGGSANVLPIEITSADDVIEFNEVNYWGSFILHKKGSKFLVVNKVDIESYLKGVVPCELRCDNFEALKAQAVAARSFALSAIKNTGEYDLKATEVSQVYGGKNSETEFTSRAVDETRGVVCTYDGKVIQARYSSTCGGRTADGKLPYLKSVACPFCEASPYYRWEVSYDRKEFFKLLEAEVGWKVSTVRIHRRSISDRVEDVEVSGSGGKYILKGGQFRALLDLKSTYFDLLLKGDKIVLKGRGFGHGVGMCQWGVLEMASKGYNYKSILRYYYKGVKIERIY